MPAGPASPCILPAAAPWSPSNLVHLEALHDLDGGRPGLRRRGRGLQQCEQHPQGTQRSHLAAERSGHGCCGLNAPPLGPAPQPPWVCSSTPRPGRRGVGAGPGGAEAGPPQICPLKTGGTWVLLGEGGGRKWGGASQVPGPGLLLNTVPPCVPSSDPPSECQACARVEDRTHQARDMALESQGVRATVFLLQGHRAVPSLPHPRCPHAPTRGVGQGQGVGLQSRGCRPGGGTTPRDSQLREGGQLGPVGGGRPHTVLGRRPVGGTGGSEPAGPPRPQPPPKEGAAGSGPVGAGLHTSWEDCVPDL